MANQMPRAAAAIILKATITGLKFFFATTLERPEAMASMSHR